MPMPSCPLRPFAVQWRLDGKRKTRNFPTAEAQTNFAKALAADARNIGTAAFRLDEGEARAWRAFRAEVGDSTPLDAVLACWHRHGTQRPPLSIREATVQHMAVKRAEGVSHDALVHYQKVFDRLNAALGNADVTLATGEQLREWVAGLDQAPESRRVHFKRVRTLFVWLKTSRLIAENPFDGIKPPKVIPGTVGILTTGQGRTLFEKNMEQPPEFLGRLALEAFPGLRFKSASIIRPEDINWEKRSVTLPAGRIKTEKRVSITKLPENLWAWLRLSFTHRDPAFIGPVTWEMTASQYRKAKGEAFTRADIPHPKNCLRHSAGTYEVNRTGGTVGSGATMLCNSEATTRRHYLGHGVSEADGNDWQNIWPTKTNPAPA